MARTQTSTTHKKSKTKSKRRSSREPVAIALLKKQHAEVDKLFKRFEKAKNGDKETIVQTVCRALTIHAQIEEELFYPALREAGVENDLLDEAEVEHVGVKRLVGELETMDPGDDLYDAKMKVLTEYVKHHVKEEETEMFPTPRRPTWTWTKWANGWRSVRWSWKPRPTPEPGHRKDAGGSGTRARVMGNASADKGFGSPVGAHCTGNGGAPFGSAAVFPIAANKKGGHWPSLATTTGAYKRRSFMNPL